MESTIVSHDASDVMPDSDTTEVFEEYANISQVPYEVLRFLGHGSFGCVEEVRHTSEGTVFARKSAKIVAYKEAYINDIVRREVAAVRRLRHNHVISIHSVYREPRSIAFIFSPVADGDLNWFLERCADERFPDKLLSSLKLWFACLSDALAYIHSQKIRHKDIKPGNILVRAELVYYTDFGLATDFRSEITSCSDGYVSGKTPMYSPPEVISEGKRSRSADIFSLGCVFAEMATLLDKRSVAEFYNYRVRDSSHAYHMTLDKVAEWLKPSTSFNNFIEQMLSTQHEKRPSAMRIRDIIGLGGVDGISKLNCHHMEADFEGLKASFSSRLSRERSTSTAECVTGPSVGLESPNRSTRHLFGIRLWKEPEPHIMDIAVDIVFVHGLTGNRQTTWTEEHSGTCWPEQLLHRDIPQARIATFGYEADVNFCANAPQNNISNYSRGLVIHLSNWREKTQTHNRPIIFVAHGLGGLICEDALLFSKNSAEKQNQKILDCTSAIAFLGTPHSGSNLESWKRAFDNFTKFNKNITDIVESSSEMLARIQEEFHTMLKVRADMRKRYLNITCFYEELPVPKVNDLIVPMDAAILPSYPSISIHSDHIGMTQFRDLEDPGYKAVSGELLRWAKGLNQTVLAPSVNNSLEEVTRLGWATSPPTKREIAFAAPYSLRPKLAVGLKCLDFDKHTNIRVRTSAYNIRSESFRIDVSSWSDTIMHRADYTWLDAAADDSDFQFGEFDTTDDHVWYEPQFQTTSEVKFQHAFDAPPQVIMWLNQLDMDSKADWRVAAYATDISANSFIVHVDTWGDSLLWSATVTWIAYPAAKAGVFSGNFCTKDLSDLKDPHTCSCNVDFGNSTFTAPPRVLLALNSFEIDRRYNLRVNVRADSITRTGMTWYIDSWGDTVLYAAGGSFIALG